MSYKLQVWACRGEKSFALLCSFKANGLGAFSVGQRPTDKLRNLRDKSTQNTTNRMVKNLKLAGIPFAIKLHILADTFASD